MLRGPTVQFLSLLWKEYDYQLLLVLATLASLIVESVAASTWSVLRTIPQALLVICLAYFARRTYRLLRSVYPAPQVPYSICIGKAPEWFDNFARRQQEKRLGAQGVQWEKVQRLYRIHRWDWAFLSSSTVEEPDDWLRVTRQVLTHFWELQRRVEEVPIHHFYFIAPPSVVLAFGAFVGRRVPHLAYHHVGNVREPYLLVVDTTQRDTTSGYDLLNARIPRDSFEQIVVESSSLQGEQRVIIALDLTKHRTSPPYLNQQEARELVRVRHRAGIGPIDTSQWERVAQEIASLVLDYSDAGSPMDLYVNTPLALAFLIGCFLGPIRAITLCEDNPYLQRLVRCFDLADSRLQAVDIVASGSSESPARMFT